MARFRLPPPFNDPQDDVVFPANSGGAGYRGLAPRMERPGERGPRVPWWVWGAMASAVGAIDIAILALGTPRRTVVLAFSVSLSLVFLAAAAITWRVTPAPSRRGRTLFRFTITCCLMLLGGGLATRISPAVQTPVLSAGHASPAPDPTIQSNGPLVLRPVRVTSTHPSTPPIAPTHGTVSIATQPPSICTIAGQRLQTPIEHLELSEGAYAVECTDSRQHARFGVIVRAGSETRDMGHALGAMAPAIH